MTAPRGSIFVAVATTNVRVMPTNGRPARFPFRTLIVIEPGVVPTAPV
jgi:hypothetical protein